ncbi:MAG: hypothetical protein VYE15_00595, partial [Myxococcota bacterium]|nr:hypothetical protein [Myxococcota bacterium]
DVPSRHVGGGASHQGQGQQHGKHPCHPSVSLRRSLSHLHRYLLPISGGEISPGTRSLEADVDDAWGAGEHGTPLKAREGW